MPHIKNALIRYRIIDKALRNKYKTYPSKEDLRFACEEALYGDSLGEHICDSTIEKDMYAMKMEHDAPIKYSKRYSGYYYTDPEFTINEIPLSSDDIESIKFAASTLAQFKDAAIFKQFGFALNKIIDRVSVSEETNTDESDKYVQFETGTTLKGSEHLPLLLRAIKECKISYFEYKSFISDQQKKRKVVPLLLKEYRNRWYLISNDLVKNTVITYGLDRMESLEISNEQGEKPQDFNPDKYFKHTIGITTSDHNPEKVIIQAQPIAAKYIASQPFHESQVQKEVTNTHTTFELYVLITEELIRALLSYGGEVKVLAPKLLQAEIKQRLGDSIRQYG